MIFARWRSRVPEVAVDLGTAFTRVSARGRGLLADEPSLVRVRPGAGIAEAVGRRAREPGRGDARPERIAAETTLVVRPAADPLHAVISGARRMVDAGTTFD